MTGLGQLAGMSCLRVSFFGPPEYLEKSGKCPKCENVFHAADCQVPEKELPVESAEPPIPVPSLLSQVNPESSDSTVPPSGPPIEKITSEKTGFAAFAAEQEGEGENYDQTFVQADKKVTDPNQVLVWVSISCVLAIALLIGIPAIATMMKSGDEDEVTQVADQTGTEDEKTVAAETSKDKKRGPRNERKSKKKEKPSKVVADFSTDQLQAIWKQCHGGIALVTAKYGDENRTSHGVVISNNGKVAVTLSSIDGADEIRIKFALSEYGGEERWTRPVPAVTIINTRPELNLAIIQVNSRTTAATSRSSPVAKNERGVIPILSNGNPTSSSD